MPPPTPTGHLAVAATIWLTLALWFASVACQLSGQPRLWRSARWLWIAAAAVYLIHVAAAFHVYHHWSHQEAFDFVQDQAGFGPGIFITYAFTGLWAADALWWWAAPASRDRRPLWLAFLLHGFMVFILFNGAVIFAAGPVRWLSLAGFLVLAGLGLWTQRRLFLPR
ncbi:MAG TPA: hypothetical protein PKD86_14370 [Gemmatales bacterium]|nr:hypothetical protein [Gemmatales bacterium]HMP60529.1 hypothetical protein [Gemmatales bacterium]